MKDKFKNTTTGWKNKFLKFLDDNKHIKKTLQTLHIRDTRDLNAKFRTIYANQTKPHGYDQDSELLEYSSNQVTTSKYTIFNFLPKNLFEQFRRIANIYFLINTILIFATPDPPTSPYTALLPLLFVVIVTAIKQGYEDVLRHREDKLVNNFPARIIQPDNSLKDVKWKDIRCGDIVEVMANQAFPCDLLLLYSKTDDNKCFITTANLDGETNLKPKSVMTSIKGINDVKDLSNFRAVVQYEKPNLKLYDFNGKTILKNKPYPITNDNILLRGCNLRVAPVIYGLALYTGKDTKVMKNSKFKSNKLSVIERRLNIFIIVFIGILGILAFLSFGLSFIWTHFYMENWYLYGREPPYFTTNYALYCFIVIVHFANLYNYIVPLSMYVTIELQRFVGSQFIQWDLELYDEETDTPAKANTSDLNEDLGQIEYLFSDKTGTLTQNEMVFKQFAVDGIVYEERGGFLHELNSSLPVNFEQNKKVLNLLNNLAVCHTVQLDKDNIYQASSPDEYSFIKFCIKLGIVYKGDRTDIETKKLFRTVDFQGDYTREFEILEILEFDSTRKRMSVILRDTEDGQIILYCKGAESFIIKKCTSGDFNQTLSNIESFGEQGWRTLALSYKIMSEDDYKDAKALLNTAYNDILDRNAQIAIAFDKIESDMVLIGSTAVEDKLQEDVAITLETIRRAGIKVWVLTGDKKETAINISNSCKHFSKNMEHLIITDLKNKSDIDARLDKFKGQIPSDEESKGSKEQKKSFALTIDGATLGILFNENLEIKFRDICMKCDAVLCCRMSPAQKALVVRLVKSSPEKPMTCSIGDGANDVSMIQEAHVGLGIFGKEGRNAALSADFAFAKFKFLKRILLVHGYLYYTRSANLVQYFFYKNLAFVICQFYYAFFNAFSVASLYDSVVLTMYNITFTAAPILLFGLCEQKVDIEKIESNPYLYMTIKKNKLLRTREFIRWNALAIWHSLVAFFFTYAMYESNTPLSSDGKIVGNTQLGAYVITLIVLLVHFKLLTEWQYKSIFLLVGYFMSLVGYVIFALIPNSFVMPEFSVSLTDSQTQAYWVYYNLFSHLSAWFNIVLVLVTAMLPDIIFLVITNLKETHNINKLRNQEEDDEDIQIVDKNKDFLNYNQHLNNQNNILPKNTLLNDEYRPHSRIYDRRTMSPPREQNVTPLSMHELRATPQGVDSRSNTPVYEFTPEKRNKSRNSSKYQTDF